MVNEKFFENPFDDYFAETSPNLLESDNELRKDLKISHSLEQKWHQTIEKFKSLNPHDYSVYTGTAGIALLKLLKDSSKANLEEARKLLPLHKLRGKGVTFLCGDAGPLAIATVIDFKLGNNSYCDHVERLKAMEEEILDVNSVDLPSEFLYGRSGYLFAILYVNKNVSPPPFDVKFIRKIIEVILLCGKELSKGGNFKCPLMYKWHDSYYLGAAHGVSGILYLLLQIKEYLTESELNTLIRPTIDYLSSLRFPSSNFPSSLGRDSDKYVQWCHGAPGFLYLYCSAYKVFGDPKYLQLAVDCGEVVWQRGVLRKGYSICHGVSGNAYCFLELFQTTQEMKFLHRAVKFAEWCLMASKKYEEYPPDRPLSLFEGIAGPMYLLLDIQRPLDAKFPGFTL